MSVRPGLDERQKLDWLRLSRTEGVGPRTFQGLINRFGGAAAALDALPALAAARGRQVTIPAPDEIRREMAAASRLGIRLIASGDPDYPERLLEIDGPPPILAVAGDVALLNRPAVAIIGARNASATGRRMAARFAEGLAQAGYIVVSGLARGIDTDAHRAALAGGTIAVLAGGLDRPYPPENEGLYEEIVAKGAAISEMPLGLSPRGRDFPRRNRLISGLSLGVVVIEAARRSGSLITARLANEQGREVFAMPGSPLDPRCEGTNDLLREGATIVTTAEDVLAVLRPLAGAAERAPRLFREASVPESQALMADWDALGESDVDLIPEEEAVGETADQRLLTLLSADPVEIDTLARLAGITSRAVQSHLAEFELAGLIVRLPGNRVARA
ncbi:MAG: DNA-processing protein DprA [Proteobacteria bacterium]|nr:DNA-processing protein DprA [Pseudomonadota bacterium]